MAPPTVANPERQSSILLADKPANQLSEENIRQTLKAIEKAIAQKDVEGVLKFVAPFVYIEMTVESNEGTVITPVEGKDSFRNLLQEIFARTKENNVVNQQTKIDITSNGELGIANISTVETLTTSEGKRYFSSSTDTFRFAWINNQPTIFSITIRGWLAERSPQK